MVLENAVNKKRLSAIGFCTGVIAGLATITPGSGFVQPGFGIVFGFLGSVCCFYSIKAMHYLQVDDSLDVTAVHGVGGALGMVLTGIFAQFSVTNANATPGTATAGWIEGVWIQVPIQLAAIAAIGVWSAVWTALIMFALDSVLGFKLRVSNEDEMLGLDMVEVGEHAYPFVEDGTLKNGSYKSVSVTTLQV
ncbi:hypothetical protein CcCBS67573_g09399 [Chytriomyces confervae]|uniref:Ammonium transporter AmtB-like domain-containing protein n=1 Tax=Chytriomyces confervae TaxID=246404 RepID=A0A507DXX4_9FUNG|nr:hypothetical protein CcCBS67573_g09399 [Chytriomyces confervae]